MGKKHIHYTVVFITCLMLFISPLLQVLANAEEVDQQKIGEKKAELESVQQQLGEKEAEKNKADKKAKSAYALLLEMDRSLKKAQAELDEINNRLAAQQAKINAIQNEIKVTEQNLKKRTDIYAKRLRDIYKNGQLNYLDVLFGANDFADFSTRMELLQRIIQKDIDIMKQINKEKLVLLAKKVELEKEEKGLQEIKVQAEAKRQVVAKQKQERQVVYNQAAAERDQLEREYNELMEISRNITRLIRTLESGGKITGSGTGQMIWPVRGEITSYYGWRVHPIFGTQKYHSGMDIAVDYGVPVMAADSGNVIHSGWMGGYGYTVILDHGGGLTTLYAHNSELAVEVGTTVYKGQTIAFVGSTGYSTGPHVHFEVRIHGELTEPLNYLPQ